MPDMNMELEELKQRLNCDGYIADDSLALSLYLAEKLGRPLLVEGPAGVGKTEAAKAAARAFGRELVRLQCYEGLDETKALYEWNYQKQLLAIQTGAGEDMSSLFSDEYLLERPLLKAVNSEEPVVLLIDEIDKADSEFEAFLLEMLGEMQVTIPEYGTIRAKSTPFVVLTGNRTRPLSEALRRRCAYLYIDFPNIERESQILMARLPGLSEHLAKQVSRAVAYLRESGRLIKRPSIAEAIDWAAALQALGSDGLDDETCVKTIGFCLKNDEDIEETLRDDDFIRTIL